MAVSLEIVTEHRGIREKTLQEAGVYWVDGDDYAVRIPYYNYTGVWYERLALDPRINPKGRPKILSPKNAAHHMYNPLRLGPNADFVVFCEGEYDTLSVMDAGFPAVGSQGTNTFAAVWTRLFGGATNIIAFDSDDAGKGAAIALRKWFVKHGANAYIMEPPEDKDLNDLHKDGILEEYIWEFLEESEIEYA